MKKYILFLMIFVLLIFFISCADNDNRDTPLNKIQSQYNPINCECSYDECTNPWAKIDERFTLDPDKEKLPSYFDQKKVEAEMTLEEVHSIMGLPQSIRKTGGYKSGLDTNTLTYVYETSSGISLEVIYGSKPTDGETHEFGVVRVLRIYPDNFEYILPVVIISFIVFVIIITIAVMVVVRRKKKNAIASNEPIDKINA